MEGLGILGMILAIVALVYAIFLFVLPFVVYSISKKVERSNELLLDIRNELRNHP